MIDTRISQYVLTRKLGAGGFGEVWCARHFRQAELQVAIKLVGPALAGDPQFVEALTQECVRLDGLDHPNIVRFRDLVMEDDRVAMVLELLQGEDLQQRLRRGPLSVDAATPILEAMLEGLGYAHSKGVMHRDVKPSNVFCCEDGRIKLLDFGIARAADNTGATKSGHMLGTVNYMAPERFTGEGGRPAGDVYAAGLVFWELLTGKAACPEGEPGRKMGWHLAQGLDAPKVRVALPSAPGWVGEVIGAMTSREAAERPADGAAALALLRRERARHVEGPVRPGKRPLPEEVESPEVKRARVEAEREAERGALARKVGEEAERARVEAERKAGEEAEKAAADQRAEANKASAKPAHEPQESAARAAPMRITGAGIGLTGCIGMMAVVVVVGLVAAITIPNFVVMQAKSKRAEVPSNVAAIKMAELAYDAAFDGFIPAGSEAEARASIGKSQRAWEGGVGWEALAWEPDGPIRGGYWVTVSGGDFTVHGICDVDGDGVFAEYTATRTLNATLVRGSEDTY